VSLSHQQTEAPSTLSVTEVWSATPTPSLCSDAAGAVDAEVVLTLSDGSSWDGGVTLLPASDPRRNGALVAWGDRGNWISGKLLANLETLDEEPLDAAMDAIVAAVRDAAEGGAS